MTTLAADSFTRTTSGGWGTADTGGAWTATSGTLFSTNGTTGLYSVTSGTTSYERLGSVSATASDTFLTVGVGALPNAGYLYLYVHGRSITESAAATTSYGAIIRISPTGGVAVITRVNGTGVASSGDIAGLTITTSNRIAVRVRVSGTNPTTVSAKAWAATGTEPSSWAVTTTDSTSGLQVAGAIAIGGYMSSSATNGPISVSFDGLLTTDIVNSPPVVNAGPDQSVAVGTAVSLPGTATDSDGTISSWAWTATAYPVSAPTITNASTATATFTPSAAGAYTFQLTATDNGGASSSDTVTVTVSTAGAPVARSAVTAQIAVVDVRASTPASSGTLSYAISPSTGVTQPVAGLFLVPQGTSSSTYTVTVTESGNSNTATITATVPASSGGKNAYNGTEITVQLPTPLDPLTAGTWGDQVNAAFGQIRDALNGVVVYVNS